MSPVSSSPPINSAFLPDLPTFVRALSDLVVSWPFVSRRRLFGYEGFMVLGKAFGGYRLDGDKVTVVAKLCPVDKARALSLTQVKSFRSFKTGWVEIQVVHNGDYGRAVYWLRRAHAHACG